MKAKLPRTTFPAQKPEQDSSFRVVIVYDDYAAGRSALDTYQLLLPHFERGLSFRINIWSFELLQSVGIDPAAVDAAIGADAIIVATHQRNGLPSAISEWIEAWVPYKREQTAILIALLHYSDEPQETPSPTSDYLKNAAGSAGIDFLLQETQPAKSNSFSSAAFREPGIWPAPEGWGLND